MKGDNHLTYLPSDWTYDRLKDIVLLRNEKVEIESEEENYLELEDIEGGIGKIISRRNTVDVESAVTRFDAGDVLFGKLRPYLEKYCHPNFDGYCTGEILAFKPTNIHDRFLFYSIGADWLIKTCSAVAYGAKMPRVSWTKQLGLLDMPLPPVPEQELIAKYLDASCNAIDRAVEAKQKQLETLDALRKSIIQKAVTQGLEPNVPMKDSGEVQFETIPAHWTVRRVKDVFDFHNTKRVPLSSADRGVMTDKTYDYYGASGVIDKVDDYIFDGSYILLAEDGANLLTRSKPLAFLAKGKFWVNNHAHVFTPKRGCELFWVRLLESQDFSLAVTGSAQPKLTMENLRRVRVPVPPEDEQDRITKYLNGRIGDTDRVRDSIGEQITTLKAYRKSLTHECVTGKRRITEDDIKKVKRHV